MHPGRVPDARDPSSISTPGGLDGGPGHLDLRPAASASRCLTAWKVPIDLAELRPLLGVPGAEVDARPRPARPAARPPAASRVAADGAATSGPPTDAPARQGVDQVDRGQRVEGPVDRTGRRAAGRPACTPSSPHDQQGVERRPGARRTRVAGRDQADHGLARRRPPRQVADLGIGAVAPSPAAKNVPISGPGTRGPAQLLEHDRGVGQPEPDAAVGLGQREGEHAQRRRARATGRGRRRRAARPRPAGPRRSTRSARNRRSSSLQRDLVVGRARSPSQRSLGRPSRRSPTMLRWICAVPAAIDSDRAYSRCSTWSRWRADRPVGSSSARRARPRTRSGDLAQPLAGLVVGELEHRAAHPRRCRGGRPATRCAWSAPTGRRARRRRCASSRRMPASSQAVPGASGVLLATSTRSVDAGASTRAARSRTPCPARSRT